MAAWRLGFPAGLVACTLTSLCLALAVMASVALTSGAWAQSAMTAETAARQFAERFGVEVLDVRPAVYYGREVYVLTVMNPGGNYNAAFQVSRLMVDRQTGALVEPEDGGAAPIAAEPTAGAAD